MKTKQNFTVIKLSGRTEFSSDRDFFTILSMIGHEFASAGSNWDRPNMLLMNGKVVIEDGLADIAWKYSERNRELHEEIRRKIQSEFAPDWLEIDGELE